MESSLKQYLLIFTLFIFSLECSFSEEKDQLLEDRAIIKDIETSSLVELNVWAQSLGLEKRNSEDSQKRALARFYSLDLTPKKERTKGKIITINRAELSTYYTMEEVDESVAEFEGRVEIVIDDIDKDIQHSIVADKVNFNRTLNSVTALGNVEYIKTEKGKPELVTADSLTFNLDNWKGAMLRCVSKQDKTIDEEEMVFYYVTGEIKKSDTEVMGMNNVTIQTVPGSPYFNISAFDLWMLDSSDFVIISPFVRIGHVPVFWAPFYYHSDNNLYFNPVYGVKSREGTTFQNTLYLMGAKPKSEKESDFSFLSFDNGEGSGNMELNGLTLVPSQDKTSYSSDYSKLMIDYYSNLGLFMGNETVLNFKDLKTKIEFNGGLGFSRNIDDSDGTVFIDKKSNWNNSYIFDTEVPFRYMIDLTLTSPVVNIDFRSFSDSYFILDFYNREENFKWVDYFTEQLDSGVESLTGDSSKDIYTRDTDNESITTTYSMGIDFAKLSPDVKVLNPFVSSFIFDFKKIKLDYSSKITKTIDEDEQLINKYENFDPSYRFFVPDSIIIPLSLTLSGNFFDTSYIKSSKNNPDDTKNNYKFKNSLFNIENPEKSVEEEDIYKKDLETEDVEVILPDKLFTDEKVENADSSGLFTTNLAYSIKAPINIYGYWDNDKWNSEKDVDYELLEKSILYSFDPNSVLTYSLGVLNSFFTIKDTLKGNMFRKSYLEDDEQDNLKDIYKWNKTLLENELSLKIQPFKLFPKIEKHSLIFSYDINELLYKRRFDEEKYIAEGSVDPYYLTEEFEWTEDFIYKNEFKTEYGYHLDFSDTIVGYQRILPPFDAEDSITLKQNFDFDLFTYINNISETFLEYNRTYVTDDTEEGQEELIEIYSATQLYSLSIAGTKTTVNSGFDYSESYIVDSNSAEDDIDEWDFAPIELNFEYKLTDFLNFSLNSEYSIEDEKWDKYSSSITLGDLSISLASSFLKPVTWNADKLRWVVDSDEDKVLRFDSLTIKHNFEIKNYKFWRNRITLDIDSDLIIKKEFIMVDKSKLEYTLNFTLDIFDFLSFKLSSISRNNSLYQYWQSDYELLGLSVGRSFFDDLIKSFNLYSDSDREESNFNLYSISLDSIYKMPDWNLIFSYTGKPELNNNKYRWYQIFSLFIEWKPLSLVRSDVVNDDDNWSVSTSAKEE